MKNLKAVCIVFALLCANTIQAQEPTPFKWETHTIVPERISDIAASSALVLDTIHSFRSHEPNAKWKSVCRSSLAFGSSELIKLLVHRDRPNHYDRKSFWSEHTAAAASTVYSPLTASLSLTVAWGRMSSGMHYPSDVTVGAAVGVLSRLACEKVF